MSKRQPKVSENRVSLIYRHMLSLLPLSDEHRSKLNDRGFDDAQIESLLYKTFPLKRNDLVLRIAEAFENDLTDVPGFWRDDKGEWMLAGKPGIIFPVLSMEGEIVALKVRVDKPATPSQKYLLLSSNPKADRKTGTQKYPNGTAAKATSHFPSGRPKKVKTLRITEGEFKADLATLLASEYTVAIPGVALWKMALPLIKDLGPEEVLLSFDSDKEKARNIEGVTDIAYGEKTTSNFFGAELPQDSEDFFIGKCLASLYQALKAEGVKVFVEHWDEEAGKGIDDVLCAGATDSLRRWSEEECDNFVQQMLAEGVPGDWIYVLGIKKFIHTKNLIELDKEQFADRYAHEQKGNPAQNALTNSAFPKVDLPVYMPLQPMTYVDEKGRRIFNRWRKNELEPSPGDVTAFLAHMEYLIPEERERGIVYDWMAYCCQFPGSKMHWALLIQGIPGTGKSYLGWVMQQILGANNVSNPTNEVIHEPYTAWQKSCQLVIVEEIMARGRLELMNKLKDKITQPIAVIREMFTPVYEQPNVYNMMMFTNHEDAIIIDKTDRRYCVIFSPAQPKAPDYYKALWKFTAEHAAAILHWMLNRDLSAFEPKGHAPMTGGKAQLIESSQPPLQGWMAEAIANTAWPFLCDLVSASHLIDCVPQNMKNFANPQAIGRTLKALGAVQLGQTKLKSGSSVRLWAVRRQATWENETAENWAFEYEKWGNSSQPGGRAHDINPIRDCKPV